MFLGTEAYAAAITLPATLPKLTLGCHMGTTFDLSFTCFHKTVKVGLCRLFPADCIHNLLLSIPVKPFYFYLGLQCLQYLESADIVSNVSVMLHFLQCSNIFTACFSSLISFIACLLIVVNTRLCPNK